MTDDLIHPIVAAVGRDETKFVTELRHLAEGWFAVGAVALAAAAVWVVVWMYRCEGRIGASTRVRMFLATLRCVVILLLGVILLEPVRVKILRRWIDSYTIVLLDESSSMDLADNYRDAATAASVKKVLGVSQLPSVRRVELVNRILQDDGRKFLRDLANNNRVKIYTFSDEAHHVTTVRAAREYASNATPTGELDSVNPEAQPAETSASGLSGIDAVNVELTALGSATNLERAFRRSLESVGGAPIAGIVVMTDGGVNRGAPVEVVARYARERGVPVHVIGLGDPSAPRNVRVAEVLAPQNVFKQDPFAITVGLTAEGLAGESLHLTLSERNVTDGGESKRVDSRRVVVGPGGAIAPVTFERRQDRVGRFVYTLSVTPVDDESVTDDNTKEVSVSVIDAKTRVLLVAGGPSWDYRYVTTLLERDDTFDLSCWLQSADVSAVRDGDTVIDHLPIMAEELFDYDVVILMDPDKSEFDESWSELADTLVSEHGGGLLFAAARPRSPAFLRERSLKKLLALLPVTFDPEADLVLNQVGHYQLTSSPIEIPEDAFSHPVIRDSGDAIAAKLAWRGIGEVYWHYPVLRAKQVATVLMRHGSPRMRNSDGGHVLAATQFVGAGRSAFLAFDSTWRWRRFGERYYDRFWVQLIRYLAEGKLLGGSKRATLIVENERPTIGEAVTVTTRLLDSRYEPLKRDRVVASYEVEGERRELELMARGDRPGWFEGRFVPDRVGSYRVRVRIPDARVDEPQYVQREVVVSRPNLEILRPHMNKDALRVLAEQSAGGRYWNVDESGELARSIPDLHEEIPIRSRPTTLWDNAATLALLVTLLCVEWAVRKWNRLL